MKVGIVGAGPAGVMAAITALQQDNNIEVTFFDDKPALSTLLPTGAGRCNLAYCEYDNNELVKFYPRGGKFLLSVFSRFSTGDTINFFNNINVNVYVQDDLRIFPQTNSSKDVQSKLLAQLKNKNCNFIKRKVIDFRRLENDFAVFTVDGCYKVDKLIFAGGIKNNYELLKKVGIKLIKPCPALCAVCVAEEALYSLSGLVLKNIQAELPVNLKINGDLLFTHTSLSGPLAYKISSLCAFYDRPYCVNLNLVGMNYDDYDIALRTLIDKNGKKSFVNILSEFLPRSFVGYIFNKLNVDKELKACKVDKNLRKLIVQLLTNYEVKINALKQDGEIVTAGGVDTDYIDAKTMRYKPVENLYFCGEVLNVDGFTGGFNLQNCWSTGYIAGCALLGN